MNRGVQSVATLVVALVLLAPTQASAAPGDRMDATGTVSPGLTTTCTNQTVNFSGTVTPLVGPRRFFSFSGSSDGCATLLSESGSGTFSGDISSNATYDRSGALMTIQSLTFSWVCGWGFTNVNPVTAFRLVCTDGVSLR